MKYSIVTDVDGSMQISSNKAIAINKGKFYIKIKQYSYLFTFEEVLEQVEMLSNLNSIMPNLFPQLSSLFYDEKEICTEYEYYMSGSLSKAMKNGYINSLTGLERLKIAFGVATAIKLSTINMIKLPVLKPSHIFLDEVNEPHIICFFQQNPSTSHSQNEILISLSNIITNLLGGLEYKMKPLNSSAPDIDEILKMIVDCVDQMDNESYETFHRYSNLINSNIQPKTHNSLDCLLISCKRGSKAAIDFFNYLVENEFVFQADSNANA